MKKIMFNDRYGLTDAVLAGRKTMTRRIIKAPKTCDGVEVYGLAFIKHHASEYFEEVWATDADGGMINIILPKYRVGEIVAVAQSYHCLNKSGYVAPEWLDHYCEDSAGYENKMFVRADLMPHQIRITDVRIERLQDISEEDVYKEGFINEAVNNGWGNYAYHYEAMLVYYDRLGRSKEIRSRDPREAFAVLIDRISGNWTWQSNPWVFVYEFELVKED